VELERKGNSVTVRKTHARHLGGGGSEATPRIVTDNTSTMRYDGNNVDIEQGDGCSYGDSCPLSGSSRAAYQADKTAENSDQRESWMTWI